MEQAQDHLRPSSGKPSMAPEKLCLFCVHAQWESSRAMGSSWTGEYGTSGFDCTKGHYSAYGDGEDRRFNDLEDVRVLLLRAESCPDYTTYLDARATEVTP